MNLQLPNIVFLVAFITYVVVRGIYIERAKSAVKVASRIDVRERVLLFCVFVGNLLLPLAYIFTPLLHFADYQTSFYFTIVGTVVILMALWLFWRSHEDLGLNWSPSLEIKQAHQLVTHGVYRSIRHPMYSAILLFGLGQGLLLQNWLAGWSGLLTFLLMYCLRVSREEEMMSELFGQEYRDYMAVTGRLWPALTQPARRVKP